MLAVALAFAGSGAPQVQDAALREQLEQLARAEATWRATKPDAYEFRFQYACNALIPIPPPTAQVGVLFRVKGSESTLMGDATAAFRTRLEPYETVEKQFVFIRKALESRPRALKVSYDQRRGYPTRVCVDPTSVTDDDFGFVITDFRAAGEDAPSGADTARIVVVGGFSNIRYTEEHAYGQAVELWRQGNHLLGLFEFTDGLQADFHTGLLEHVRFNSATGELSFDAYASQFHFEGRLEKTAVKGLLKRMHPENGRQVAADQVVLKRNAELSTMMSGYKSEEEWNRYAAEVLKRLGPPGKYD